MKQATRRKAAAWAAVGDAEIDAQNRQLEKMLRKALGITAAAR